MASFPSQGISGIKDTYIPKYPPNGILYFEKLEIQDSTMPSFRLLEHQEEKIILQP